MMERIFERVPFASRWLLAPVHAALAIGIVVLLVKLLRELAHFDLHLWDAAGSRTVFVVSGLLMALTDRIIAGHHER
jgi:uncharacterized protein (TIGR00645 family)